jgi:hypothetical protein
MECEWSASRPCRVTPEETAPGTHCIGGSVRPSASLDVMNNRKIYPTENQARLLGRTTRSLVAILTELSLLTEGLMFCLE